MLLFCTKILIIFKKMKGITQYMRMRKKKHGSERMEACSDITINNPTQLKSNWKQSFDTDKLFIEIGCGKGGFITQLALQNPDSFYVAFEKVPDVIMLAMEKAKKQDINNIRFVCADASGLADVFEQGEVDGIYLNFSDPWPKKRHAKRRLTYRSFLEIYKNILSDDGQICFKTDNRPLFDFSLEEFEAANLKISGLTYDLHNSEYNEGNIQTEYEKTFSARGFTINRAVLSKK